ncbi:MAG: hypothetical protein IBX69_01785 [Anaerolineales bacterium]|nr:hypothetical protein [Anaerolineales bacterium]
MTIHFDDKGKFFTDIISKKPIPAKIQTISHRIEGTIYVRHDVRLIDELLKDGQFMAVTNAVIYNGDGKPLYNCEFLSLNKAHIVWLIPSEDNHPSQTNNSGVQD